MFSYRTLEERIPQKHPLRKLRALENVEYDLPRTLAIAHEFVVLDPSGFLECLSE